MRHQVAAAASPRRAAARQQDATQAGYSTHKSGAGQAGHTRGCPQGKQGKQAAGRAPPHLAGSHSQLGVFKGREAHAVALELGAEACGACPWSSPMGVQAEWKCVVPSTSYWQTARVQRARKSVRACRLGHWTEASTSQQAAASPPLPRQRRRRTRHGCGVQAARPALLLCWRSAAACCSGLRRLS